MHKYTRIVYLHAVCIVKTDDNTRTIRVRFIKPGVVLWNIFQKSNHTYSTSP